MITADKALQIELKLAELIDVETDDMRDYLRGYIKADRRRRTGFRFVRGSHGGSFVVDPEGTDVLPAGYSVPSG